MRDTPGRVSVRGDTSVCMVSPSAALRVRYVRMLCAVAGTRWRCLLGARPSLGAGTDRGCALMIYLGKGDVPYLVVRRLLGFCLHVGRPIITCKADRR